MEAFIGTACVLSRLGHPRAALALSAALALADAIGVRITVPLQGHVDRAVTELGGALARTGPVRGPVGLLATSLAADLRSTIAAMMSKSLPPARPS